MILYYGSRITIGRTIAACKDATTVWPMTQNTTQKSISIVFSVSSIRHDSSLSKYRKQKQSPSGNTKNGARPGGWSPAFVYGTCWVTNNAYAKKNGDGLLCSILCWWWWRLVSSLYIWSEAKTEVVQNLKILECPWIWKQKFKALKIIEFIKKCLKVLKLFLFIVDIFLKLFGIKNFYLLSFIVLRFQTSYNNCIKEAGTPQQLNTNYSGPFTKYQYKYRKQK
jgi:hypothetical protein